MCGRIILGPFSDWWDRFRIVNGVSSVFRACAFFPSNAFMASARSSNTFNCMLQTRVNWLINANMAACRLRGFKSDLVWDLYTVQPVTTSPKQTETTARTKNKQNKQTEKTKQKTHNQNKPQQPKTKQPTRNVTGTSSWSN